MKAKQKTKVIEKKVDFWSLPKNAKVSFDQALLDLGVQIKS